MLLREWLRIAAGHYQAVVPTLEQDIARRVAQSLDLGAPCQLVGFSVRNPEWQGFVVAHLDTGQPVLVETAEDIDRWDVSKRIQEAFQMPLWDQPWPVARQHDEPLPDGTTVRDAAFTVLDGLVNDLFSSFHLEPPVGEDPFWGGPWLGGRMFMHHRRGALRLDPVAFVDRAIRSASLEAADAAQRQAEFEEVVRNAGPHGVSHERQPAARGAFADPPLRVSHVQSSNIGLFYRERDQHFPGVIVFRGTIGERPLLVTHNGFFAIQETDPPEALRWLNLVMASLLAKGFRASAVRPHELGAVHLPEDHDDSWGGSFGKTRRSSYWAWSIPWLSSEELSQALRHAEKLATSPIGASVSLFLEAVTHLEARGYTESFVYAWALIEQEMTRRWDVFLETQQVEGKRRKRLQRTDWTLHTRSETMSLSGAFSPELLARLDAVRQARNEVMHGTRLASAEDAKAAVDLAEDLLAPDAKLRGPPRASFHGFTL